VVKPPLRTKTLGTKVSEEEFAQLEAAASERGLTLSEWCRETLLANVNGQGEKSADSGRADQALMAELVALRAILLNVLFKLANGEKPTAEEMQRLIDRADSDKLKKARERLAQAAESEGQAEEKS
jgi:mobilization protein NikA